MKPLKLMCLWISLCCSFHVFAQVDNDYFTRNVAIVDLVARSTSEKEFVRELLLVDFRRSNRLPTELAFDNYEMRDDGKGQDLVAGDGVYTSVASFEHGEQTPYNPESTRRSILGNAYTHAAFLHGEELEEFLGSYEVAGKPGIKIVVKVNCDFYWCACKTECGGCFVRWGTHAGCVSCVKTKNCHFDIEVDWSL